MEKDENLYEEELDIEVMDDDDSEDEEEIEEYNFNDEEEDDEDEGSDGEVEDEPEAEEKDSSDAEAETTEKEEHSAEEKPEAESAELTAIKERELELLHRLGYQGTYEEAVAAFEKDRGENKADAGSGEGEKSATPPAPDYEAMAKQMLVEINKEYGLELTDYSKFEDLKTFAELSCNENVGAVKAFAATNPKMMEEIARKAAISKLGKPQRNVQTLPKSDGGKGGVKGQTVSAKKVAEYQALFPEKSRSDIVKLLNRVNKNTR